MNPSNQLLEALTVTEQTLQQLLANRRAIELHAGRHIEIKLVNLGISVKALAAAVGVSSPHMYGMLNGRKRMTKQNFKDCLTAIDKIQFRPK